MTTALPAVPRYGVGSVVTYIDRQKRPQVGKVQRIEALWVTGLPSLTYVVTHPSSRISTMRVPASEVQGDG